MSTKSKRRIARRETLTFHNMVRACVYFTRHINWNAPGQTRLMTKLFGDPFKRKEDESEDDYITRIVRESPNAPPFLPNHWTQLPGGGWNKKPDPMPPPHERWIARVLKEAPSYTRERLELLMVFQ